MRTIIYARYSTEHQTESTIIDQLRRCREFAAARSWEVVAEYTDEGISGAAIGNRPGVQKALGELRTSDVLLVVDTTRLSRSQDLAPLLTRLRHRGIRVIGVLDGFDSDSRTARMQAGLSGIMSEEFRSSIAARTHSALDMRAREGRATGGKCYGFSNKGEVIETEAAIVREVFDRAARGEAQKAIAAELNRRGVPAPGASWERKNRRSDGLWLVSAVHSMLSNERYIGRVVWNRSVWKRDPDTGVRQRIERPESEWIVSEGPVIVDRQVWDRVRALANPRKYHGGKAGGSPKYLLSGVLVCGQCGHKLAVTGAGGSHYYCSTHHNGGSSACSMAIGARRDVAEERLLGPVQTELLSQEAVDLAIDLMRQWHREDRAQGVLPAELEELDRRISKLQAQVEAGILDREDIAPSLAALFERRRTILAASWRKSSSKTGLDLSAAAQAYRAAVQDMRNSLAGPITRARAAVHQLLGDVVCRPDGDVLVALVNLSPVPLFRAAGISWIGSGGALIIHENLREVSLSATAPWPPSHDSWKALGSRAA
jgi:site-specific DNA recombinase